MMKLCCLLLFGLHYIDCNLERLMAVSPESTPLYLRSAYPLWDPQSPSANSGERLLLTPYLDRNNTTEAKKVAKVGPGLLSEEITSYSGYFTIDKRYNSNLFFWFFPTQNENGTKVPLILWLQGGPGASSLFGVFEEIGPFKYTADPTNGNYTLKKNPFSWNANHSLLFIDNPVGTGYSYTDKNDGYATNQTTISDHLYKALNQFFKMFPEYQTSPFYISGESYGAKYAIGLAHKIHKENFHSTTKVNLKGITIGNGFADPESMLAYGEYLYQLGLVDNITKSEMQRFELQGKKAIQEKHFIDAFYSWSGILSLFITESRFHSLYHILDDEWSWDEPSKPYVGYIQSPEVRRALHVGDTEYTSLGVVYYKMIPDFMTGVRSMLEEVIENYRVCFYTGQLDIIAAYPLAVNLYNVLKFSGSTEYRRTARRPWFVGTNLAGYTKSYGNFTEVLVRNAGHMVPADQPLWSLELITKFTRNDFPGEVPATANSTTKKP